MADKKRNDFSGLLVPAGLLIGLGVGLVTDQVPGAMFIGLGLGLLGMFIAQFLMRK